MAAQEHGSAYYAVRHIYDNSPGMNAIRAISLWNPWATAMCRLREDGRPPKITETRHWEIGGPFPFLLAIHAAKRIFKPADYDPALLKRIRELKFLNGMVYGAVLGIVTVTGCKKVDDLNPDADDLLFGNYVNEDGDGNFQQRFGWTTDPAKIKVLKSPYYCRGAQGVFTWTPPEGIEYK